MPRRPTIPQPYFKSGQLAVTLRDPHTGYRRTVYLGAASEPQSRIRYAQTIADWESGDRAVTPPTSRPRKRLPRHPANTVTDVIVSYWLSVRNRYTKNEKPTSAGFTIRSTLRRLRQHVGNQAASDFGPRALRAYRDKLIAQGDLGRDAINRDIQTIVRVFKWAVSDERVPASLHQALACVEPIRRDDVEHLRESRPVEPVSESAIVAVMPFVPPQVAALIKLQRLTGARAGEIVGLCAIDIDTSSEVWLYQPKVHKNAHRGHARTIPFGPRCQEILRPFMTGRPIDRPLFSPAEAEAHRRNESRARRRTPESCGNRPGTNRVEHPKRAAGNAYTTASYRRCIERACDKAFPVPDPVKRRGPQSVAQWKKDHRWTPHQLRHTAATEMRRQFGLETTALVLGHASPTITDAVYAQRDNSRMIEAMKTAG